MKAIVAIALGCITLSAPAQYIPPDTTIRGVTVSFFYRESIFPESWRDAPINANGEQLQFEETGRCKRILTTALKKYPIALLQRELQAIYFLRTLSFYNVDYGGTNSSDAVYLTDDGEGNGYNDLYLEQTFHHEFSSILYRNYSSLLNETAWLAANQPGFDYIDPENGVGAIRNNQSSQELDTALCKKGFLTQYSESGMENDLNTFAQHMFSPSPGFWNLVDNYRRIATKFNLLVLFYNSISPLFTENYFRKLGR